MQRWNRFYYKLQKERLGFDVGVILQKIANRFSLLDHADSESPLSLQIQIPAHPSQEKDRYAWV